MADGLLSGGGRRAALDDIGAGLIRYIPPEWRALAGLIAEANPVRGIERAGQAARRLAAPEAAPMERVAATGNVLSEMAGVLAPAAVAGRAGMPAVQAVQEGLLGMSAPARAAGEAVIERLNQPGPMPTLYSNPIMRAPSGGFTTWHGSPHIFKAERLVRMPDGSTQYLVGDVDRLPDVPPGAQVIEDFPMGRFRMSQIGTGEGAQAYGPGLYFAEKEEIARSYRDALSQHMVDGRPIDYNAGSDLAATWFKAFNDRTKAADYLQRQVDNPPKSLPAFRSQEEIQAMKDAIVILRSEAPIGQVTPTGKMYEVNIAAKPEEFIDYDAPLSAQSPNVQRAFGYVPKPTPEEEISAFELAKRESPNNIGDHPAIKEVYRREAGANAAERNFQRLVTGGGLDADSLPWLLEQGIPGVRYLDAGSRGAGDGTRNYVLFNEDLMRIVRVYGIAGAAAMLGMSTGEVEAAMRQAQGRSVPGLLNMPSDEELRLRLSTYLNGG